MVGKRECRGAFLLASMAASFGPAASSSLPYPPLATFEKALLTTAVDDFGGQTAALGAALRWNGVRLRESSGKVGAPHLACVEYGHGREALSRMQSFLSPETVRLVSHSKDHGACYLATLSRPQAAAIIADDAEQLGLTSLSPFPSALKLSPGLLEHGETTLVGENGRRAPGRLAARHGESMRLANVAGLTLELSPGTLPSRSDETASFIGDLLGDLMSESLDLHSTNVWSDPSVIEGEHLATPEGALRGENWGRAATVVHELSEAAGSGPGDICSWESVIVHHGGDDLLLVSGLDHLLFSGRGAGGSTEEESTELHVACFMGLVSVLAARMDVLRVSSWHSKRLLNESARNVIQSATATDSPLTDAGLDGTGEVIQIIDTGVDETSCYFIDDDGEEVDHGYYYDELSAAVVTATYVTEPFSSFNGGDFAFYPERRKIIQYIDMINPDSGASSYSTPEGNIFPLLAPDQFGEDDEAGHGTHTAGSAAGATLNTPAETLTCGATESLSCVGACIDGTDDDLVSSYYQYISAIMGSDLDRLCPMFGCDDATEPCLSDDVSETLTANGGVAQGAKLSIFDVFYDDFALIDLLGNDLWEPCSEAGCRLHSSSLGADAACSVLPWDVMYDDFMYQNPENLLIFAAGNQGEIERTNCTINSPAIAKNSLAIGATFSGETRVTSGSGDTDIDTVASLSSYGPTVDGRIKPEVVAPGDMVYSAAGDGTDTHSCRLWAYSGTSMSCPIVAGAAAMIRQYFVDDSFYAADVTARGFCSDGFLCEGFLPSAATVKALLINSANLMGGSSEPDGYRGFGRVHLEAGMPLAGEGSLVLFVADAADTSVPENTLHEYLFDVDADAGLDLRVTLSWIDPPASTYSIVQLVHDLDLIVVAPDGVTTHRMWGSDMQDSANVNERVIVDAADVETGTYTVWVWANALTTDDQAYSLVVNGAISPGTGEGASAGSSFDPSNPLDPDDDTAAISGSSFVSLAARPLLVFTAILATVIAAAPYVS